MKLLMLLIVVSFATLAFASSGGSSGTGSGRVLIAPGLESRLAILNSVFMRGNDLVDRVSGQNIIRVSYLPQKALARFGENLVPSDLGAVNGFEYLPDRSKMTENNFWVICLGGARCLRLTPLVSNNPKVIDVIGGLKHEGD